MQVMALSFQVNARVKERKKIGKVFCLVEVESLDLVFWGGAIYISVRYLFLFLVDLIRRSLACVQDQVSGGVFLSC